MTTLSIKEFELLIGGNIHSVEVVKPTEIKLCILKDDLPNTRVIKFPGARLWVGDQVVRQVQTWKLEGDGWQPNGWRFYAHPVNKKMNPAGYCIELITTPPNLWEQFLRWAGL